MQRHKLIQGSPEWHEFRLTHFGASEAAAMLGLSKHTSRDELLYMKATGDQKVFSDWVQENVLNKGHEVEALARPLINEIIGDELYPVTCSDGDLSASCDGLTLTISIAMEHKQYNEKAYREVLDGMVPEEHVPQCQQVLMVTGAKQLIFVVSDGTIERLAMVYVKPDPEWFKRIRAGWDQFAKDLANYQSVRVIEMPAAEATMELPALFIHAEGSVTTSNMKEFGVALASKLAEVRKMELVTDQDFSNADDAAKMFRDQIVKLTATEEAMLSQTVTIGEASRMIKAWKEDLRITALQLEKDCDAKKKARKQAIINEAKVIFAEYFAFEESRIDPIKLLVPKPDFELAMKGKSLVKAWQNAVNTELAKGKIMVDEIIADITEKYEWYSSQGMYSFLFADLQSLIYKQKDDFQLVVTSRIEKHKQDELRKEEQLREKIALESTILPPINKQIVDTIATANNKLMQGSRGSYLLPTDKQIIDTLAATMGITYGQACDHILRVADNLRRSA